MLIVRPAKQQDASAIVEVLNASIRELCVVDHENQSAEIEAWLSNKTLENVAIWIDQTIVFVALDDETVVAVAAATKGGYITLNYVHPNFRFRGASKTLLDAVEKSLSARGIKELKLESTRTAERFYIERGYVPTNGGLEMVKHLSGM